MTLSYAKTCQALVKLIIHKYLDAFLLRHGQTIRVAPDSLCGFLHGKAGVIERADGRKVGFIGSMNETKKDAMQSLGSLQLLGIQTVHPNLLLE